MPLNFIPLPMMELRSAPGDVLDRVAHNNEAFVIERNGNQMACLVPLSVFMPAIQPARIAHEYERLLKNGENPATSITDGRELQLQFKGEGTEKGITITIRLPHGYPNASPKVYAHPLPESCPHRWQDGSLCILGAMDIWNPGQHDVVHVLGLTRRWLDRLSSWQATGTWGGAGTDG
jgi:ubiquitin-protein ligase